MSSPQSVSVSEASSSSQHDPVRRTSLSHLKRWVLYLVGAALVVSVAAGCGSSADPETWAEAEEHGYVDPATNVEYSSAVEFNFMTACLIANAESGGGDLNDEEAYVLCQCSFVGLRERVSMQEFKALDQALRETPNPSDLDEEPEDTWDDIAEQVIESCARRVDA